MFACKSYRAKSREMTIYMLHVNPRKHVEKVSTSHQSPGSSCPPCPPLSSLAPLLTVAQKGRLFCVFVADRDEIFVEGIFDDLINQFSILGLLCDRKLRWWELCAKWMAKVVDVKFTLANFPTDAQEKENSLHDGCNEEHDPA